MSFQSWKRGTGEGIFWAIGYGGWYTGNIIDEMVQECLEHHRDPSDGDIGNIYWNKDADFQPAGTTYGLLVHSYWVLQSKWVVN